MLQTSLHRLRRARQWLTTLLARSGYSAGLLVSITLHALLVALVVIGWVPREESRQVTTPSYIEAQLLQMEPAVTEPQQPQEEAPEPDPEQEQQKQEQEQQEQARREREQKEAEAERQRRAEQQRREEQARREKERQEEQRREKEREEQRQRELERQRELQQEAEARRRKEQEQALARELAEEAEYLEAAAAEQNAEAIGTYSDYMRGLIADNWNRPPSARRDMKVELEILLGAAGRVTGVRVIDSSGSEAFDRSAEQAVLKVGQFSRLQEMEPALYQEHFRRVHLVFRPEDLRK